MAGFGKNSRGGKRGSSSSSYISTTTMLLFVGFCLFGLYMLTSSSTTNSHISHHKRNKVPFSPPRIALRDPPPLDAHEEEDTQGDLPEDDSIKGDHVTTTNSAGTEDDSRSQTEAFHHQQQEEEVETHRQINEEEDHQPLQGQHVQEDDAQQNQDNQNQSQDDQQQNDANIGQSNEEQQQHDANEEQQQSNDQNNANEEEEHNANEEQHQNDEHNIEGQQQQQQQQHSEEQSNDEQHQQQSETNGTQEETNNNEIQQQTQTEINDNQDQNQLNIQQVTDDSDTRSEEGGITSKSQIQHDSDGTTENQQQQEEQQQQKQEEKEEEHQQQEQQQEEEEEHQQQEQQQQQQEQQQQGQQQQDSSQPQQMEDDGTSGGSNENDQQNDNNPNVNDSFPDGSQSENKSNKKTWATQADQSSNEKERRKGEESSQFNGGEGGERNDSGGDGGKLSGQEWELCNVTAGPDYIPCLDNEKAIKKLHSLRHYEHRERHCPEESPTCLVALPKGYRQSIEWPQSRDRIWYNNVPRTKLAEVKGHQNWVKVTGEYLTFPGGGTQFIHGALHYIDFIQQSVPEIAWGKHTRVILDVGCGVASFGGYLFERDVLAMSFAPKDEHEAQVQFALERGIPAISAVMGSQRLPFPSSVFDIVHCARCRVPWQANDGALLLELNRVLRPGGFFVWSATPVYQKLKEDVEIWEAMTALTKSMCWDLYTIKNDKLNSVGAAMFRKPVSNDCYDKRKDHNPPMCKEDDDPNAAWYVSLQSCMHRVPVDPSERGSQWPQEWPRRAQVPPYWLNSSQVGVYGRPAPDDFTKDYEHWKRVVNKSYLNGFGIDWSKVRNVMDMRAVYGGFAAALKDMKVWVMNLVSVDSPDTLPIIYERGLFGMYHDWCESFSTYPRTYDLLHADRVFSQLKKRCKILPVIAEVDRIARPGGKLIVRDESDVVSEVENLLKSLHWDIRLIYSRNQEGILCAEKSDWRPEKFSDSA